MSTTGVCAVRTIVDFEEFRIISSVCVIVAHDSQKDIAANPIAEADAMTAISIFLFIAFRVFLDHSVLYYSGAGVISGLPTFHL